MQHNYLSFLLPVLLEYPIILPFYTVHGVLKARVLQLCRNITLSINIQAAKSHTKPIDTSELTTGHFIALQREEIQLQTPELP